jgi:uncharacterized protein (DUF433 family)
MKVDGWMTQPPGRRLNSLDYQFATHRTNMNVVWQDYIESTPNVLRGKPRIKGTRIPVSLILGYLAASHTPEQIITEFPDLTKKQIIACLDYARELAEFELAG